MPRNVVRLHKLMYTHEENGERYYAFAPYFKIISHGRFDIAEISKVYYLMNVANKRGGDFNFDVYDVTREGGVIRSSSTFESMSPEDFRKKLRSGECRCLRSCPK